MRKFESLNANDYCWWCRKPLYDGTGDTYQPRWLGGYVCWDCHHSFVRATYDTIVKIVGGTNTNE